jgi:putative Mn2+ efflux pump MntP
MELLTLIAISIGLAMDAFAVSIGKGLSVQRIEPRHTMSVGLWFGGFQALMPLIGYFLGVSFASLVQNIDHWIAFILLGIIGVNMIREATAKEECECEKATSDFSSRKMLLLAIATSIDAMAVGISFACVGIKHFQELVFPINIIGLVSFILSIVGLLIGICFGKTIAKRLKAELWGGIILLCIGIKILIEHLFFC